MTLLIAFLTLILIVIISQRLILKYLELRIKYHEYVGILLDKLRAPYDKGLELLNIKSIADFELSTKPHTLTEIYMYMLLDSYSEIVGGKIIRPLLRASIIPIFPTEKQLYRRYGKYLGFINNTKEYIDNYKEIEDCDLTI